MNDFYPDIEPYNHFLLPVDDQHEIYIEECGNPNGQAILFIHGGPGGGCSAKDRRFFNPEKFRIILFDQRGCGRSLPHGCLKNNTTTALVEDIEKIRNKLAINSWHVFGGSWGSTLSLVYAQAYPEKVKSLTLRGIYLGREQDTNWTFAGGGATRIYPDYWQEYLNCLPEGAAQGTVQAAYKVMIGEDKALAMKVAKAWSIWEIRCCTLIPDQKFVDDATADERAWTLARHEAHFMFNKCFLSENQILNHCGKIKDIPTTIVHGRYDIVCPYDNAWQLHLKLPNSRLITSEGAGHSSSEPNTRHHLINATNALVD